MPILRILLIVALAVVSVASRAEAAEPPPGDVAIEEQLDQGIALRRSGNDESALTLFLGLEKEAPDSIRLLLHIATAAQATGRWIMAYDYLQKAESHKDDPYYQRHKAAIDNVEKAVDQHVGEFRVRGVPLGAEVRLSGQIIGTMPMVSPKAMEVGSYVLEVSKAGYFPIRRPIVVTGGGSVTQEDVELRLQSSFLSSAGTGQADLQSEPARDAGPPKPTPWWRARWVTWSLAGVAVAAGATSGVAFAIREADASHWNDNSRCLSSADVNATREQRCGSVRHDIDIAQDVGIAAGITAVAFGGAALVHGLLTPQYSQETGAATRAHAECGPGLGTVVCSGSF